MGLGQGIQNAGNLFAQAILAKHEEEQRLQREALAQQNELTQQRRMQESLDLQRGNAEYDRSFRTVSAMGDGDVASAGFVDKLHPQVKEAFTRPQMELPNRDMFMGKTLEKPEATGQYTINAPYRKELEVAKIRAGQATDVANIRANSAEKVAEIKRSMTEYQKIMAEVAKGRLNVSQGNLGELIRYHKEIIGQREYDSLLDAQTRYDLEVMRQEGENPGFKPSMPRPTGATKPGAKPAPYDPAKIDWSGM
jgi:predicted esterase YcpF (UPF0227 family)